MAETDKTKFIVRNPDYPQNPRYGDFCVDAVKRLQETQPETAADALEMLRHTIGEEFNNEYKDGNVYSHGTFGALRETCPTTALNHYSDKYASYAKQIIRNAKGELGLLNQTPPEGTLQTEMTYTLSPAEKIPLSRFKRHSADLKGYVFVQHGLVEHMPANDTNSETYEKLWGEIEKCYALARNGAAEGIERRDAALECYYLFSHAMPLQRGSASAGRILLEYLAQEIGMPIPHVKAGHDLNMEALTRSASDFKRAFLRGEFLDARVTSQQVLDWQAEALASFKKKRSTCDVFHDIVTFASEGANAELYTVKRSMISKLLHTEAKDKPHITIGRAGDGEIVLKFIDPDSHILMHHHFFNGNKGGIRDERLSQMRGRESPYWETFRQLKVGDAVLTKKGMAHVAEFHPIPTEALASELRSFSQGLLRAI